MRSKVFNITGSTAIGLNWPILGNYVFSLEIGIMRAVFTYLGIFRVVIHELNVAWSFSINKLFDIDDLKWVSFSKSVPHALFLPSFYIAAITSLDVMCFVYCTCNRNGEVVY